MQNFAKSLPHVKRQRSQTTKLCYFVNFMTCPNIILIEKKKLSTDSYVSGDPCVYEPFCYELMVGKVYYAIQILYNLIRSVQFENCVIPELINSWTNVYKIILFLQNLMNYRIMSCSFWTVSILKLGWPDCIYKNKNLHFWLGQPLRRLTARFCLSSNRVKFFYDILCLRFNGTVHNFFKTSQ